MALFPQSRRTAPANARPLRLELLEPRQLLAMESPAHGWLSAVFDGEVDSDLQFEFSRDAATTTWNGQQVLPDTPRFAEPHLGVTANPWSVVRSDLANVKVFGSGWDHDGTTPLAVFGNYTGTHLYFVRGNDFALENVLTLETRDIMQGAVAGFRYRPRAAIVHEGLVVIQTERSRLEGETWIQEGVSFFHTQDYGTTIERVAHVDGGFDIPGIAGGVADGIESVQTWGFSNAFPEKSVDDQLGAWFPWADYLNKEGKPKGGQIGLFRARRPAVGQPWVVEPNVTIFERWEVEDSGGLHSHSGGMFVDGVVSFWGDVDYRNHMTRHVASDLENYTTSTWTHDTEFQGAWSPDDDRRYLIGNQAAATAPAQEFGSFLTTGDLQSELLMKISPPDRPGGPPLIENLDGSILGGRNGNQYAGHISLSIHYLPGRGYVANEGAVDLLRSNAIFYSQDGEEWTTLSMAAKTNVALFGDYIIQTTGGNLYASRIPTEFVELAPLSLASGGINLLADQWNLVDPPEAGNQLREVEIVNETFVYVDSGLPLAPQPAKLPPFGTSQPIYEASGGEVNTYLGTLEVASITSDPSQSHRFSAWFYPLEKDGIAPLLQYGDNAQTNVAARWVANTDWVPSYITEIPSRDTTTPDTRELTLFTGTDVGETRWLIAPESLVASPLATYPLVPGASGSPEVAKLTQIPGNLNSTFSFTFSLPEVPSFSAWQVPDLNAVPLATIRQDEETYITLRYSNGGIPSVGTVLVDFFDDGQRISQSQLGIRNFNFDVLEPVTVIVSVGGSATGVTTFSTRNAVGIQSVNGPAFPSFNPREIALSTIDEQSVSPLHWYAVHVHPGYALNQEQREGLLVSGTPVPPSPNAAVGDYNANGTVDLDDYLVWRDAIRAGSNSAADKPGDYNEDGIIDNADYQTWQTDFATSQNLRSDGNGDGKVDIQDYLVWKDALPMLVRAADGNRDGVVDNADFDVWKSAFQSATTELGGNTTTPASALALSVDSPQIGSTSHASTSPNSIDRQAPQPGDNPAAPTIDAYAIAFEELAHAELSSQQRQRPDRSTISRRRATSPAAQPNNGLLLLDRNTPERIVRQTRSFRPPPAASPRISANEDRPRSMTATQIDVHRNEILKPLQVIVNNTR